MGIVGIIVFLAILYASVIAYGSIYALWKNPKEKYESSAKVIALLSVVVTLNLGVWFSANVNSTSGFGVFEVMMRYLLAIGPCAMVLVLLQSVLCEVSSSNWRKHRLNEKTRRMRKNRTERFNEHDE